MPRTLLTGAGGFVGRALALRVGACESLRMAVPDWAERVEAARFEGATVFHLAARVHAPDERDERAFQQDNVEKTRRLALAAAKGGARRLVFLSSIKVHGEESPGRPYRLDDVPAPQDAYARSKLAAEQALARIASDSGLSFSIVRSPLVYGPDPQGNLGALLALADTRWPLPIASLTARRSFVHVDDLARLLVECGTQAAADGRTYLAAHAHSVTAPEVLGLMRAGLARTPRLFPCPAQLLERTAAILGQGEKMRRLTRALEADPSAAARDLGWEASVGIEAAVDEMARTWRAKGRNA